VNIHIFAINNSEMLTSAPLVKKFKE